MLHEVQLEGIMLQELHSFGHIRHENELDLSMEFGGHASTHIP